MQLLGATDVGYTMAALCGVQPLVWAEVEEEGCDGDTLISPGSGRVYPPLRPPLQLFIFTVIFVY